MRARSGMACTSLRMSRCFEEEPRLVAIYRLYRGVDAQDVAQAHELALEAARPGHEIYNVSAPSPFGDDDCPRLLADAASVLLERYPWAAAEFARRGLAVATVHRPRLCCGQGDCGARLQAGARFCLAVSAAGRLTGRAAEEITMSSVGYHEPIEELSDETRDMHRAIVSLMEELEAIDWYNQRADACKDPELRAILAHNRDEEKEHAAMVLEWIRRHDPVLSKELKEYLFSDKPIAHG